MFGYVIPDKPNMFIKDFYAFRAFYCGLCKAIGKQSGCLMRFATNYDMTILNVFVHNVCNKPVEYTPQRCILHPFRKREMIKLDELSLAVADVNTLLTYHKLQDNIVDSDKVFRSKTARLFVKKSFKKALKRHKEANTIIEREYKRLNELEKNNCSSIDEVSDAFATLLADIVVYLTKSDKEEVKSVAYCLGKWVYLIDALDDIEKDHENNRYNPWISALGFSDIESFLEKNRDYVNIIMKNLIALLKENYDKLPMPIQEGVLSNTFYYGLEMQTDRVLRREQKCQKTRL